MFNIKNKNKKDWLRILNYIIIVGFIIGGFVSALNELTIEMNNQQQILVNKREQKQKQQEDKKEKIKQIFDNEINENIKKTYKESQKNSQILSVEYEIVVYKELREQIADFIATNYGTKNRIPQSTENRIEEIQSKMPDLKNTFNTTIIKNEQKRTSKLNCFLEIDSFQYENYNQNYHEYLCQGKKISDFVGPLADYNNVYVKVNNKTPHQTFNSLDEIETFLEKSIE